MPSATPGPRGQHRVGHRFLRATDRQVGSSSTAPSSTPASTPTALPQPSSTRDHAMIRPTDRRTWGQNVRCQRRRLGRSLLPGRAWLFARRGCRYRAVKAAVADSSTESDWRPDLGSDNEVGPRPHLGQIHWHLGRVHWRWTRAARTGLPRRFRSSARGRASGAGRLAIETVWTATEGHGLPVPELPATRSRRVESVPGH
jgi:hypothetical protein